MALSSRLNWLPRWRDRRQSRRYRSYFIDGNVLVHSTVLLPHLEQLELRVRRCDGSGDMVSLHEAVHETPRLRLVGSHMSGKRLALRQLCLQWVQGDNLPQDSMPLLHTFEAEPTVGSTPLNLLCHELASLGFVYEPLLVKRTLAAGMWTVMLEGWERLGGEWQANWQVWCEECVTRYPALTMIVAVPPQTPAWPQFTDWELCEWEQSVGE